MRAKVLEWGVRIIYPWWETPRGYMFVTSCPWAYFARVYQSGGQIAIGPETGR